ncbi:hypothetical protein, partial [Paraburkholderia eburnea]|uniref:hypothetical protein n=1 Tax=Paraburkholderia eburnea TaxID=1189126 RepID=UPI001ABF2DEF
SNHPAASASLRLQQRNEIMKALFRFVNIFFSGYCLKDATRTTRRFSRQASLSVPQAAKGANLSATQHAAQGATENKSASP